MADLSKIGGDSQNTMPIALNAGMAAVKIAKAVPVDPAITKFSLDAFKTSMGNIASTTSANLPIADALQQQSGIVRLASKIPFVGKWLGSEGQMNNIIGTLDDGSKSFFSKFLPSMGSKGAAVAMNKVQLTRALYGASTPAEIQQIVASAKIADPAIAKQLIASAEERLAGGAAQTVAKTSAQAVVKAAVTTSAGEVTASNLASEAAGLTLKKGFTAAAIPDIEKALTSANPITALRDIGFKATDAKTIVAKMTTSSIQTTVKDGATSVVQSTTTSTTEVATETAGKMSGVKNFFGKLLGGAKGNFIVAGVFSLASNGVQLAQGKINIKQFAALTVMDTGAYGLIGLAGSAVGGAVGAAAIGAGIGTLIPIPFIGTAIGFAAGMGVGLLGGWLYEKFIRTPAKDLSILGGTPAGGSAPPSGYNPNPSAPGADPYGANAPAAPSRLAAPIGATLTYDQAMAQINSM